MASSSKSRLYEICVANHWDPPLFECSENDGQGHRKLFTSKVTVELQLKDSTKILECRGAPQPRKKSAEQHAAEGALWYLRHLGYL
ncbi:hypothetical protein NMG60_11002753 [Bertholletia excelsa]